MVTLKHKSPCSECPWRKESLPGWLGGFPPEWFAGHITAELPLTCHKTLGKIDGLTDAEVRATKPLCAGSLIQYRNMCKLPRDPALAAAVKSIEPSPEVFAHPIQFLQHHENPHADRS